MAVFQKIDDHQWRPTPLARGPFAGLQGGAVAGLLAAEIELQAEKETLGSLVAIHVEFLRPTPMQALHTRPLAVRLGRRVSFYDNAVMQADGEVCARAHATIIRAEPIDYAGPDASGEQLDPERFVLRKRAAPHGEPWFMDAMEARAAPDGVIWFRMTESLVEGAGAFAQALGPADWCHGLNRPLTAVFADPNPDLSVRMVRAPRGPWLGVRGATVWQGSGAGLGHGVLMDAAGDCGAVSMSVALAAIPKRA